MRGKLWIAMTITWLAVATSAVAQDGQNRQRQRQQQGGRQQIEGQQLQRSGPQRRPGQTPPAGMDHPILAQLRGLELSEEQRRQVRELMQVQRAKLNVQRDPQERARRQEVLEKLRSQGLQGEELRRAAMQELGIAPPDRDGNRPPIDRDQMQQQRAQLLEELGDILTPEQMGKLEESLRNLNRGDARRRGRGEGLQPPPNRRDRQGSGEAQGERGEGGKRRDGGGKGGRR